MSDPKLQLLTPKNCQVIFIDHQPQMAFGVQSMDRQVLKNNTVALAKAAKVFGVPVTITTVETLSFSGHTYPELLAVFPEQPILERTSMNSWDDQKVRDSLAAHGRKKVVVSGLWTEVCNNSFALDAMREGGYEIYMVADASGGTTAMAHDCAMQRMVQVGRRPGHLAAGDAGMAARLGPARYLRRRDRHRPRAFGRLRHGRRLRLHRWSTVRRNGCGTASASTRCRHRSPTSLFPRTCRRVRRQPLAPEEPR